MATSTGVRTLGCGDDSARNLRALAEIGHPVDWSTPDANGEKDFPRRCRINTQADRGTGEFATLAPHCAILSSFTVAVG